MKRTKLICTVASICAALAGSATGLAQENGSWRAASKTARSITGDLFFSSVKLSINFASFPLAQIRELTPAELVGAFNADSSARGSGNLYRVSIPATKLFLHRNALCGSEETQWVVTYVAGHTLQMALFSGAQIPVLTAEALGNSTDLCGTYTYVR